MFSWVLYLVCIFCVCVCVFKTKFLLNAFCQTDPIRPCLFFSNVFFPSEKISSQACAPNSTSWWDTKNMLWENFQTHIVNWPLLALMISLIMGSKTLLSYTWLHNSFNWWNSIRKYHCPILLIIEHVLLIATLCIFYWVFCKQVLLSFATPGLVSRLYCSEHAWESPGVGGLVGTRAVGSTLIVSD